MYEFCLVIQIKQILFDKIICGINIKINCSANSKISILILTVN